MPLVYQQNINLNSSLGLWHIAEDESFFRQRGIFTNNIRHPHKRLQTSAGRLLLGELFPHFPLEDVRIAATKKPFLEGDHFHFSISHCDDYAAAIVSTKERVGVDIEVPQPKIESLKNKFLSTVEQHLVFASGNDITDLTMAWCMKEAVYKWFGSGGVDFREHMPLVNFLVDENGYKGEILFRKGGELSLVVHGILVNGNCLAWIASI